MHDFCYILSPLGRGTRVIPVRGIKSRETAEQPTTQIQEVQIVSLCLHRMVNLDNAVKTQSTESWDWIICAGGAGYPVVEVSLSHVI